MRRPLCAPSPSAIRWHVVRDDTHWDGMTILLNLRVIVHDALRTTSGDAGGWKASTVTPVVLITVDAE